MYSNSHSFPQEYSFLSLFENPYNVTDYGLLDVQGIKDMQNLAKRAIRRYNNIIQSIDDIANVHVYSTNVSRVIDSATAFIKTIKIYLDEMRKNNLNKTEEIKIKNTQSLIFDQNEKETVAIDRKSYEYKEKSFNMLLRKEIDNYKNNNYFQNDEMLNYIHIYNDRNKDIVLSPHIACPLFFDVINSNNRMKVNKNLKILENRYIQNVISNIKKTLHLKEISSIVGESVMSMCVFEVALNNTRNQFCSLIDVCNI